MTAMLTLVRLAAVAATLALPVPAFAQQPAPRDRASDLRYCAQLSDLYVRYIGRAEAGPHSPVQPDVNGGIALAQCRDGNPAAAIPVLEQKLVNGGFTLPPRT
jgi:hypothetical protein